MELDTIKSVFCRLAALISAFFPNNKLSPSSTQEERLGDLLLRLQTPFDSSSNQHVAVLQEIWKAGFPELPWIGQKSKDWSRMGWQGMDPATDLRGGGFLALECLLDLHQTNEKLFLKLMNKTEGVRSQWEYPFATAGVNITFTLIEMFHLRSIETMTTESHVKCFLTLLEKNEKAFEDLYQVMFALLDRNWIDMKATYMEFSLVLKKTKSQMEEILATNPRNVNDLKRLLSL